MSTLKQDTDFGAIIYEDIDVNKRALGNAIEWIKENLDPFEVFNKQKLIDWASGEEPDTIFSETTLSEWAESNGYTKE